MAKKKKAPNKIHTAVRYGSEVFLPDNEDHADRLAEQLKSNPRSCTRLLTNGVVSGADFEDAAKEDKDVDAKNPPWEKKEEPEEEESEDEGDGE